MEQRENKTENKKEEDKIEVKEQKENENVVFIGSKPLVNYIKGVITQFNKRDAPQVTIKARGKFISKAVDVAEVSRRTLEAKGIKIRDINVGSESFESEGKSTNISTMDIVLSR